MKRIHLLLIVTLCFITQNIEAQDLLDGLKQVADMHNEEHGNDSNNNQDLSEEEQRQAEEFWKEKTKDAMDFINGIDKPYHQCLALMGLYSYHFLKLSVAAEEEEDCKMKYDWYGTMLLMNISGTFLLPCTEGFYNLPEEDQISIFHDFLNSLYQCNFSGDPLVWTPLAKKAPKIAKDIHIGFDQPFCSNDEGANYYSLKKVYYLLFEWEAVVANTLAIGKKMEALGCGG
ncbi:MAG: hypothetical protein KJO39_11820 [Bacteroidia bacterium]|nr:hypothetical protein [Bacteroidia bacterium]NNE15194.1 hypothetical protein [Saprospiraceae bacterium]NNK55284.1 hypothetical protein [Flavobacteriaceae bacterium]